MAKKLTEAEQKTWDILSDPGPLDVSFTFGGHRYNNIPVHKPGTPTKGQVYYDVDNHEAFVYDGTAWQKMIY